MRRACVSCVIFKFRQLWNSLQFAKFGNFSSAWHVKIVLRDVSFERLGDFHKLLVAFKQLMFMIVAKTFLPVIFDHNFMKWAFSNLHWADLGGKGYLTAATCSLSPIMLPHIGGKICVHSIVRMDRHILIRVMLCFTFSDDRVLEPGKSYAWALGVGLPKRALGLSKCGIKTALGYSQKFAYHKRESLGINNEGKDS